MVADWRALYPFDPHWHPTAAGRLHYLDEGKGDPLLFVHGNPTWSFYWRRLIQRFSPRQRCVAPDHLGSGLSDKPQRWTYRLADHIANLESLVLTLDLTRITLVVHDWGGAIGLGLAGRHPERFARLAILNSGAFRGGRMPLRIAACRLPLLGSSAVRGLNAFARAATVMATARGLEPAVKAGLLAPYGSWHDRIGVQRFVEDIPMRSEHPSHPTLLAVEAGLARLRHLPATLIWGEQDWCFTTKFLEGYRERFPGARVIRIPEAGHYVVEDAPEAVGAGIQDLLGRSV